MNDRVSSKPPRPYLDDKEEFLGQNDAGTGGRGSTLSSKTDSNRHSLFRFGKSIAASFNPNNWKIWSKDKHVEEEEEDAQTKALRERQEKAERIYRELKESGRFRDAAHVCHTPYPPTQSFSDKKPPAKHDSGVEFGDSDLNARHSHEMTREDKRMGRIFLEPPFSTQPTRSLSPVSNVSGSVACSDTSSPSKRSFMIKKASLSNINARLKKPSLSNIKKSLMGESRESLAYPSTTDLHHHHQARRVPSRKDLQKQQRLVKRVSDLEGKLEAARRQLSEAIGEPVPALPTGPIERVTRRRFRPGALASLPSERLLNGYVSTDDDIDDLDGGWETHTSKDIPIMSGPQGNALLRPDATPQDVTTSSMEGALEVKNSQDIFEEQISEETLLATAAASIGQPAATKVSGTSGPGGKDDSYLASYESSDKEATPKPMSRIPSKKRKNAFESLTDDGKHKPSENQDETDESEIKNLTPKSLKQTVLVTPRPIKLQKMSPSTLGSKMESSPQNSRVSASRVQPRPFASGIQALSRGVPSGSSKLTSSPAPVRKLSKVQRSHQKASQQSVESPPSSPTFMGMKDEEATAICSSPRDATSGSGRIDPANLIYSADPNTEPDVPPMPPLPKNIRLASGEVISTSISANLAKPQLQAGVNKLTKPRSFSPRKHGIQEKKLSANEARARADPSFEWPDDVF
jgi:hypothetical protein